MYRILFAALIVVLIVDSVYAATFGDLFKGLEASVAAGGSFMKLAFGVLGFACVGGGVYLLVDPRGFGPQNSPFSELFVIAKIITILAGAMLLKLAFVGSMAANSLGLS